jgi:predicted esterase
MRKAALLPWFLFLSCWVTAQVPRLDAFRNAELEGQLAALRKDPGTTADAAWKRLTQWNTFPAIRETNRYYVFVHRDSVFGDVPVKVFIPKNYQATVSSPVVLILHGAVVLSSFKDAYKKDTVTDEDLFYRYFENRNFVVIRPYADGYGPHADGTIKFDWVVNRFEKKPNPTFQTLGAIIAGLKHTVNIDDNRVYAWGHSDGSDGAFALQVYKPSGFAGFVAYNSMLTHMDASNIYLKNARNRPLYLVHSSLDHLRPIEQARAIARLLDSLGSPVQYKEYAGYKHYDKHLSQDLPLGYGWLTGISRRPFPKAIYWEASDNLYNRCDWLKITRLDTTLAGAPWHKLINTANYDKVAKKFEDAPYYPKITKGGAVNATYKDNTFRLQTSRTEEVELLIHPEMVNLDKPVNVYLNGKLVFNQKVVADKTFLLNEFSRSADRRSLWVSSIQLKCE